MTVEAGNVAHSNYLTAAWTVMLAVGIKASMHFSSLCLCNFRISKGSSVETDKTLSVLFSSQTYQEKFSNSMCKLVSKIYTVNALTETKFQFTFRLRFDDSHARSCILIAIFIAIRIDSKVLGQHIGSLFSRCLFP